MRVMPRPSLPEFPEPPFSVPSASFPLSGAYTVLQGDGTINSQRPGPISVPPHPACSRQLAQQRGADCWDPGLHQASGFFSASSFLGLEDPGVQLQLFFLVPSCGCCPRAGPSLGVNHGRKYRCVIGRKSTVASDLTSVCCVCLC